MGDGGVSTKYGARGLGPVVTSAGRPTKMRLGA
jgi:hypothetical protein